MADIRLIVKLAVIVPELQPAEPMVLKKSRRLIQFLLLVLLSGTSAPVILAEKEFTLYLVRHAEKAKLPKKDPLLTEQGHKTAKAFADYLDGKMISRVFSTNFKRTMQTASHYAEPRRILIQKYDHKNLDNFAKDLLARGETSYVVGHSNTTPTLIALLGGIANPIEEHEYGDIYELTITDSGVKTAVISVPR